MKAKYYLKGVLGFLLLVVVAVGCKKEDEVPEFEALSFDGQEVLAMLPAGLTSSDDEYAQDCVSWIESVVDMSSFIGNMAVPEGAQKTAKKSSAGGDTWSWTWSYGGESFTFYWTYDEDNSKRYWSMDIQFGSGPMYDYIDAWETLDGTQGEVTYNFNWVVIYDGDPMDYEDLYWQYSWTLDSSGAYHLHWWWDSSDPEFDFFLHYEVIIYADGSGTIDYYSMDTLFYHMEWDVLGNGSWAWYFGDSSLTGNWTV